MAIPDQCAASGDRNPTQNMRPAAPALHRNSFARGSVVYLNHDLYDSRDYEVFYNKNKAMSAYNRALNPGKDGWYELLGEDGSYTAWSHKETVVIRRLDPSTKADPERRSFLNLTSEEEMELSKNLQVPVNFIKEISTLERFVVEKRRFYGHNYDAKTSALIRKYAPRPIAKFLLGLYSRF